MRVFSLVTYAGSREVIVWPDEAGTNSLLMKSPVGWVYRCPLGVTTSIDRLILTVLGKIIGLFGYDYSARYLVDILRREAGNGRCKWGEEGLSGLARLVEKATSLAMSSPCGD